MVNLENRLNDIDKSYGIIKNQDVIMDLVSSLLGKRIGFGCYREVFEYNLNPDYVVKIELEATNCNVTESMLWEEIQHLTDSKAWVKKWFAPVSWISPNGKILVMRRTDEKPNKKKPERIPSFLWDVKDDNFGWIGNNFVCHDYGQFYNFINYNKRTKKANWWDDI